MNRLKELRKNRGFTQKSLAEEIGVSQACISRIESGADEPSLRVFLKICKILKITTISEWQYS